MRFVPMQLLTLEFRAAVQRFPIGLWDYSRSICAHSELAYTDEPGKCGRIQECQSGKGVCGLCAGELDTAFLLREFRELGGLI